MDQSKSGGAEAVTLRRFALLFLMSILVSILVSYVLAYLGHGISEARPDEKGVEEGDESLFQERVHYARVQTDVEGVGTQLWRTANMAIANEEYEGARAPLLKLLKNWPTLLVDQREGPTEPGNTPTHFLPASRLVHRTISGLPETERAWYEHAFAAQTHVFTQRAKTGDATANEKLASQFASTKAGVRAQLMLCDEAAERGDWHEVVDRTLMIMDVTQSMPVRARAQFSLRYLDAVTRLGDEAAVQGFGPQFESLLDLRVSLAHRKSPLRRHWLDALKRVRARQRTYSTKSSRRSILDKVRWPLDGETLKLLWTRSFDMSHQLRDRPLDEIPALRRGLAIHGEQMVVHEGSTVRAHDLMSGYELWHYPKGKPPIHHAPDTRYLQRDIPFRDVTIHEQRIFVVLGDPACSGTYRFAGRAENAGYMGQEERLRLVALDGASGEHVWSTGGPTETHPILSKISCGVSSTPLVVGDQVYLTFTNFEGGASIYAACLDASSGALQWLSYLGRGISGRSQASRRASRFSTDSVDAPPFGQRPQLHGGHICICTQAGMAASVTARDGHVSWVRSLPRYSYTQRSWQPLGTIEGASVRNHPLAFGASWVVAPMDCPDLLCFDASTGATRWRTRGWGDGGWPYRWRHLVSLARNARGATEIRLVGDDAFHVQTVNGSVTKVVGPGVASGLGSASHAIDMGDAWMMIKEHDVFMVRWDRPQADPKSEDEERDNDDTWTRVSLPLALGADRADFVIQDGMLSVATAGTMAVFQFASPSSASNADAQDSQVPRIVRAARRLIRLSASENVLGFQEALEEIADAKRSSPALDRVKINAARRLFDTIESDDKREGDIVRFARVLPSLPVALSGSLYRDTAMALFDIHEDKHAKTLLHAWIERGMHHLAESNGLSDDSGYTWLRGDLFAARLLRENAGRNSVLSAQDVDDTPKSLPASLPESLAGLREAIRKAVGTKQVDVLRSALLKRLKSPKTPSDTDPLAIASVLADLRLDPPVGVERTDKVGYDLAMQEVELLTEGFEDARAENLLASIALSVPHIAKGKAHRARATKVQAIWDARGDTVPPAFDPNSSWRNNMIRMWPQMGPGMTPEHVRSIAPWSFVGPGAVTLDARSPDAVRSCVVIQRGLGYEIWSVSSGSRIAEVDMKDRGWFGSALRAIDRCVPGGGVYVHTVVAQEPADRSGVSTGDWVREWNGQAVKSLNHFMSLVAHTTPGKEVPVKVIRRGVEVMSTFRAGRRPATEGGLLDESPIWLNAKGEALTVGRLGLHWIRLRDGSAREHWHWHEPGLVRRALVSGRQVFVVINRRQTPDLLICLDLDNAKELWRIETEGSVVDVEPVGSAIWIRTVERRSGLLIDRISGSTRFRCRPVQQHVYPRSENWTAMSPAAVVAGRVVVKVHERNMPTTLVVNSTTGHVEWRRRERLRAGAIPQIVAGGFAASPRTSRSVDVYFPHISNPRAMHRKVISNEDLVGPEQDAGRLNYESRLYARGRTLYLVQMKKAGHPRHLRARTLYLVPSTPRDPRDDRPSSDLDRRVPPKPVSISGITHKWMTQSSTLRRYVLSATLGRHGLVVGGATLAADDYGQHEWIPSYVARSEEPRTVFEGDLLDARRDAPVWSSGRLLVPVDEGIYLVAPDPAPDISEQVGQDK